MGRDGAGDNWRMEMAPAAWGRVLDRKDASEQYGNRDLVRSVVLDRERINQEVSEWVGE